MNIIPRIHTINPSGVTYGIIKNERPEMKYQKREFLFVPYIKARSVIDMKRTRGGLSLIVVEYMANIGNIARRNAARTPTYSL
jgi:hypothetical protein